MPEYRLVPFQPMPDAQVDVRMECREGELHVWFHIRHGDQIAAVQTASQPTTFADGLWRSTCAELFIGQIRGTHYLEWNFAPDGRWAVYFFERERALLGQDFQQRAMAAAPRSFRCEWDPEEVRVHLSLSLRRIHDVLGHPSWRIQPTAVLETRDGERHYWAPSHPKPTPDFHALDHLPAVDPYQWTEGPTSPTALS